LLKLNFALQNAQQAATKEKIKFAQNRIQVQGHAWFAKAGLKITAEGAIMYVKRICAVADEHDVLSSTMC